MNMNFRALSICLADKETHQPQACHAICANEVFRIVSWSSRPVKYQTTIQNYHQIP